MTYYTCIIMSFYRQANRLHDGPTDKYIPGVYLIFTTGGKPQNHTAISQIPLTLSSCG